MVHKSQAKGKVHAQPYHHDAQAAFGQRFGDDKDRDGDLTDIASTCAIWQLLWLAEIGSIREQLIINRDEQTVQTL